MNLLAFDTSTEACSVAISKAGEVTEKFLIPEQKHTQILLPTIEAELAQADLQLSQLDALVYGRGPGAFTGVRLAVSVAQGLGFSADLPVLGVSSLAAVAQQVHSESKQDKVLVALDARMSEVYFAAYEFSNDDELVCMVEEKVCSPSAIPLPEDSGWLAAGTGWRVYENQWPSGISEIATIKNTVDYPQASAMMRLATKEIESGNATDAAAAVPVYLRNNVAKKPRVK